MTHLKRLLAVAAVFGLIATPLAANAHSAPDNTRHGLFLNMDIGLASGKYNITAGSASAAPYDSYGYPYYTSSFN